MAVLLIRSKAIILTNGNLFPIGILRLEYVVCKMLDGVQVFRVMVT